MQALDALRAEIARAIAAQEAAAALITQLRAPPPAPPPPAWMLPAELKIAAGGTIDLAQTLPDGVPKGGLFALAADSAPLAAGISLTAAGLVRAAADAAPGSSIANVKFAYAY